MTGCCLFSGKKAGGRGEENELRVERRTADALVLLVAIAYGLFRIIPGLADLAAGLYELYSGEIRKAFRKKV